jgi:predicted tellurium resistance membrane protein TerC
LLTLTALEIVLGIDNVIFLSVIVSRIPKAQAARAARTLTNGSEALERPLS